MTACSLWCSTTKRAFKVMLLSVTPGKHVVGAACQRRIGHHSLATRPARLARKGLN